MDVVATTTVEETGEIILVCGLSCYSSAVADAVEMAEWAKAVAVIAACGLFCCLSSVVDTAITDWAAAANLSFPSKYISV